MDTFKSAESLAVLKLAQIEIAWCDLKEPLWLNDCTGTDVVARCEYELVVEDPVGFVVNDGAWVDHDHLIIL